MLRNYTPFGFWRISLENQQLNMLILHLIKNSVSLVALVSTVSFPPDYNRVIGQRSTLSLQPRISSDSRVGPLQGEGGASMSLRKSPTLVPALLAANRAIASKSLTHEPQWVVVGKQLGLARWMIDL
jgi:hypothetical protein